MKELLPGIRERFLNRKIDFTKEQEERIAQQLDAILSYTARIGFFGKTGSGKSSLCNALFGEDVAKISDIAGCTREPQEFLLKLAREKDIVLVDVPGVGETLKRDDEYFKLYKNLTPELDAILWIIKADDRAFSVDELCWKDVVRPHLDRSIPVVIVINQVDKFNPLKEWCDETNTPGPNQLRLIQDKIAEVARAFDLPIIQIVPVSAHLGYNIPQLVETLILSLPKEKKASVFKDIPENQKTENAKKDAERGFFETFEEIIQKTLKKSENVIKEVWEALKPHIKDILIELLKYKSREKRK